MGIGKKWKEILDVTDKIAFTNHVITTSPRKKLINHPFVSAFLNFGLYICRMMQEEVDLVSEEQTSVC